MQPYLNDLNSYRLPLCAAYPAFGWQLLYAHNGEFKAILYEENLADTTVYRPTGTEGKYTVVLSRDVPIFNSNASSDTWINVGDTVLVMRPTAHVIELVHNQLQQQRPGINDQVVLYSLDSKNLKYYNTNDYETIFSH